MASIMQAMVEALPMVMQVPGVRDMPDSAAMKSSSDILPPRTASLNFQTSVPDPMSQPRNFPFSMGPLEITSVGRSTLAAPMS